MAEQQTDRNRAAQRELYGEPLGEVFRRAIDTLGLTQGRLAATLGLSAPMLSQLMTAQRVKIGNPAVLHRLDELNALVEEVRGGRVGSDGLPGRLDAIRQVTGRLTRTTDQRALADDDVVATLRGLLRAVASGQELAAATELLEPRYPALAELLTTYGLGSTDAARAHLSRHRVLF